MVTTGDRIQDRSLSEIGGKGLFIKEIEEALLDWSADIAIHSLKDVPAELAPSLAIGCIPPRVDPRDVIVTRTGAKLAELAPGSKVGTSSLRRKVQLAAAFPSFEFVPLRGNVDTRLRKCSEGVVDAIVLAHAGLLRLGLSDRVTEVLEPEVSLPGRGSGRPRHRATRGRRSDVGAARTARRHRDRHRGGRGARRDAGGGGQLPAAGRGLRPARGR